LTNPEGAPITIATPTSPTIAELQQNGFMPTGYAATNPSNLAFTVNITLSNCPGVGCQLPATITSTPYRDSQGNVRNDLMSYAVAAAGLDGGQALVGSPGQYTGSGRSWSMPNGSNQAGSLVMRAGMLTTGYVDTLPYYKTDGSRPLTGTMNANGQGIVGAANVQTSSLNATNATVNVQLIARQATVTGVLTTSALNAANASVGQNLAVGNTITANTATVNGLTNNGDSYTAGNQTINGVLNARNVVNLPALAWEGWGCGANGVTTDPNGQILSCQAGIWKAATSTVNNYYPTTYVNQSPTGGWVTKITGGPCGGFVVYYADGTSSTVMTTAGCDWGGH
jgi:hypothetical protein